jgi:hypothetical protein
MEAETDRRVNAARNGYPRKRLEPRLDALAEARALMDEADVHDLGAVGTYSIGTRTIIQPGYHLPRPTLSAAGASPAVFEAARRLEDVLVARGKQRFKSVSVQPQTLHFVQNPVTDAVIIGRVVDFVDDGELVIGKDVTSLVIITETLRAKRREAHRLRGSCASNRRKQSPKQWSA